MIIARRDHPRELSEVGAIVLAEFESGARLILISDGVSLEIFGDLNSPNITLDLGRLTSLEVALLIIHLASLKTAEYLIVSGAPPQIGVYLARLRWALARLNTRCVILVDGPLTSIS